MPFLTTHPIDVAVLQAAVARPDCGAVVLFLGTVRASAEDGAVVGIEYSAYDAMAEAEFGRIVAETAAHWPAARVALQHRVGYVPTGEASVAIAAAAPHRAEAYEASRYVIEETKKRVPVWKKEHLAAGSRWVETTHA